MALTILRPPDEMATVLALLHNLLEVSKISAGEISEHFGQPLANAIVDLTVDRTQTTHDYTVAYYRKLMDLPRWARVIKVLDKLDNLFVLCLNPNEQVRNSYLADIEEFVMPMVTADLPHLVLYMRALIADCRKLGFLNGEVSGRT
jgi:(p)ppGpp synthase/HD superfamily hydrolase